MFALTQIILIYYVSNSRQITVEIMTKYVEVNPSKRIFTELGYNTYEYIDLVSELIDNSIAARIEISY